MLAGRCTGIQLALPVWLLLGASAALTLGCKASKDAAATEPTADAPPTEASSAAPVADVPAEAPSPAKADVPTLGNLVDAARARDSASVKALLASGADPNEPNERGATPLFFAVQNNDTEMIVVLAKEGADLNYEGGFFQTALGIDADRTQAAITLIELGADIEATGHSGRGPLQAACGIGNVKVATLLIEQGADVNTNKGMVGMTPLHNAAASGSTEIIELLLARGAKVNATAKSGNTALHFGGGMMSAGSVEVARLLIKNGAKVNAKNEKGQTPVAYARKAGQDPYADEIAKHGGTEG